MLTYRQRANIETHIQLLYREALEIRRVRVAIREGQTWMSVRVGNQSFKFQKVGQHYFPKELEIDPLLRRTQNIILAIVYGRTAHAQLIRERGEFDGTYSDFLRYAKNYLTWTIQQTSLPQETVWNIEFFVRGQRRTHTFRVGDEDPNWQLAFFRTAYEILRGDIIGLAVPVAPEQPNVEAAF